MSDTTIRSLNPDKELQMKILKFSLRIKARQEIEMPASAQLLSAQMQGDTPQLWALCNEHAKKEYRLLSTYGTGERMPPEPGIYVATFQACDGLLVWHLFDLGAMSAECPT